MQKGRKWGEAVTMQIRAGDTFDPRSSRCSIIMSRLRGATAPGSAHALISPDFATRRSRSGPLDGETLVATGALKTLLAAHGEVKSMHTLQTTRRRGFGGEMLRHHCRGPARGLKRLSLETGSWDYFKPAHALYRRTGLCLAARSRAMPRIPTACF